MTIIDPSVPRSLGETLGGMMGAVIDAQTQAARSTIDFIQEVGTLEGISDSGSPHNLRNLSFNYTKNNEEGMPSTFNLEIPLLSMVEIPAINVKVAKFSFYYDVVDLEEIEENVTEKSLPPLSLTPTRTSTPALLTQLQKPVKFKKPLSVKGRIKKTTQTTTSQEQTSGIKIDVEFEKSALPVGLDRVMDMLELAAKDSQP